MGLGSILGAVAPIVGSFFGGPVGGAIGSAVSGVFANEQKKDAAHDQMAFQEAMSSSAHQREVQDLISAGLNPILSAKYGGASTPSGAMPVLEDAGQKGINTSLAATRQEADLDLIRAQVEKTKQDTNTGKAEELKAVQEAQRIAQDTTNMASELYNIRARLPNIEILNELYQLERGIKLAEKEQRFADVARLRQLANLIQTQQQSSALHLFYDTLQYPKRQTDYDIFSSAYGRGIQYLNPAVDLFSNSASAARDIAGAFRGLRRPELHFHNDRR